MDRTQDSGSCNAGSNPAESTRRLLFFNHEDTFYGIPRNNGGRCARGKMHRRRACDGNCHAIAVPQRRKSALSLRPLRHHAHWKTVAIGFWTLQKRCCARHRAKPAEISMKILVRNKRQSPWLPFFLWKKVIHRFLYFLLLSSQKCQLHEIIKRVK